MNGEFKISLEIHKIKIIIKIYKYVKEIIDRKGRKSEGKDPRGKTVKHEQKNE